jgi:hypothetical protein
MGLLIVWPLQNDSPTEEKDLLRPGVPFLQSCLPRHQRVSFFSLKVKHGYQDVLLGQGPHYSGFAAVKPKSDSSILLTEPMAANAFIEK